MIQLPSQLIEVSVRSKLVGHCNANTTYSDTICWLAQIDRVITRTFRTWGVNIAGHFTIKLWLLQRIKLKTVETSTDRCQKDLKLYDNDANCCSTDPLYDLDNQES